MNTLQKYLFENKESLSAFAARIGRAPSTLLRAVNGLRNPSVSLARDVEVGSNGVVSASAFLAICIDAQTGGRKVPSRNRPEKIQQASQATDADPAGGPSCPIAAAGPAAMEAAE